VRLGVEGAVVDGAIVPGDVLVDPRTGTVTDVGGPGGGSGLAAPGFVDLQVNGFAGVDLMAADTDGYARVGEALAATGVTAFVPTFITAPHDTMIAAMAEAGAAVTLPRVLGVHLEGPFLSPDRLGTHPAGPRRDPDPQLLDKLLAAGPVRIMTLAPELPGALDLVRRLVEAGVVASIGHSDATAEQAHAGFDAGALTVTHLGNAMRSLRPREPGVAGAALARGDVIVQLIVDGHHLAPETVQLAWRAAADRFVLVTDAVAAAGMSDGTFKLSSVTVYSKDGRVTREDGKLAGSALTMDAAVRNLHALGAPLAAAIGAATAAPARVLASRGAGREAGPGMGRDRGQDLGRLAPGCAADIVVLDDRLEVTRVLIDGRQAHGTR
jgi:N-acetylglucosamine-6-phosphate deacetylase